MQDFYQGGIVLFGGLYAPRGFAYCRGQTIAISQNQALFAILGTTWGGNGRTSFGLPDLRGTAPIGSGQFPGQPNVILGQHLGTQIVALSQAQLPSHSHSAQFTPIGGGDGSAPQATVTVNAHDGMGDEQNAKGNYWATAGGGLTSVENSYSKNAGATMATDAVQVTITGGGGITGGTVTVQPTGAGASFSIMQPSLGIDYIIALQGTFPPRS